MLFSVHFLIEFQQVHVLQFNFKSLLLPPNLLKLSPPYKFIIEKEGTVYVCMFKIVEH